MNKILIIEDNIEYQQMLKNVLEKAGFEIKAVSNGKNGLKLLQDKSFDLVITDIFMPVMEGLETIRNLKSEFENVKVIAISGGGHIQDMSFLSMAKELGADFIIKKPIKIKQLISDIKTLLQTV